MIKFFIYLILFIFLIIYWNEASPIILEGFNYIDEKIKGLHLFINEVIDSIVEIREKILGSSKDKQ